MIASIKDPRALKHVFRRSRAVRLIAGNNQQGGTSDSVKLIAPVKRGHQSDETCDVGRIVLCGLVQEPTNQARIGLIHIEALRNGFGQKGPKPNFRDPGSHDNALEPFKPGAEPNKTRLVTLSGCVMARFWAT